MVFTLLLPGITVPRFGYAKEIKYEITELPKDSKNSYRVNTLRSKIYDWYFRNAFNESVFMMAHLLLLLLLFLALSFGFTKVRSKTFFFSLLTGEQNKQQENDLCFQWNVQQKLAKQTADSCCKMKCVKKKVNLLLFFIWRGSRVVSQTKFPTTVVIWLELSWQP